MEKDVKHFYLKAFLSTIVLIGVSSSIMILIGFLTSKVANKIFIFSLFGIILITIILATIKLIFVLNNSYRDLLLKRIENNPDKIKFAFTDGVSKHSILICDDVLFVGKKFYQYQSSQTTIKNIEFDLKSRKAIFIFNNYYEGNIYNTINIELIIPESQKEKFGEWARQYT